MHELSIVMSIVDIAEKEAIKANVKAFSQIELEIGTQSGIVLEALDFAWKSGVANTVLSHAKRSIFSVQAQAECTECNHLFDIESIYDTCPKCNSYFTEIIKGKELKIKSLVLEESS